MDNKTAQYAAKVFCGIPQDKEKEKEKIYPLCPVCGEVYLGWKSNPLPCVPCELKQKRDSLERKD